MKLILKENKKKLNLSEGVRYHLKNGISIQESIFRIGSESWCDLINEVRELQEEGLILLSEAEQEFIDSDAGEYGLYEGEDVPLDAPFLLEVKNDGTKVYGVFVLDENEQTKKVVFKA
jgi:hypothetical protein